MTSFDVFVLDVSHNGGLIALARRGADTAIEPIPIGPDLHALVTFGRLLGAAVSGQAQRPSAAALNKFGQSLFGYLFRGQLKSLYDRLPTGPVSIQILSNRSEVHEVPWEYLVTPDLQVSPHRDRSVIRVHPTCGIYGSVASRRRKKLRVLFVSADPVDQQGVNWSDVEAVLQRTLSSQMPERASIKIVEGATRQKLLNAIQGESFDIFHFFGHGDLVKGVGHLILQDISTRKSDYLSADELATVLAGKNVRLAILSACLSGTGKYDDDFGALSTALITAGVPAVVANQYPIPIKAIAPFVGSLYASLVAKGNIDSAVADGRIALKIGVAGGTGADAIIEWGIPTLHRLADAQQIFKAPQQ